MLSDALANTLPPVDTSVEIGALLFPVRSAGQGTSCLVSGKPISVAALDATALARLRPQSGGAHSYYAASSESELQAALSRIRHEVGSCTYLTSSVPDAEGTISVSLNGVALEFDDRRRTGWTWVDRRNGEILLAPGACAALQAGGARVEATLTCASL